MGLLLALAWNSNHATHPISKEQVCQTAIWKSKTWVVYQTRRNSNSNTLAPKARTLSVTWASSSTLASTWKIVPSERIMIPFACRCTAPKMSFNSSKMRLAATKPSYEITYPRTCPQSSKAICNFNLLLTTKTAFRSNRLCKCMNYATFTIRSPSSIPSIWDRANWSTKLIKAQTLWNCKKLSTTLHHLHWYRYRS